ncbi:MAG TPA: AAA family ATPase [Pirellulales bacterium]
MAATILDNTVTFAAERSKSPCQIDAISAATVELLKQSAAYPDRPKTVSLVETHISWVFLTDRFVYKLKKPVRFDFVDFSTPEARRRACLAECELNSRMARGVYLGVLPIAADARGRLALNGQGVAVDWVVKMRRLPAERMLDHLLRTERLGDGEAARLAAWLANYYDRLSPVCLDTSCYRSAIERHVRGNHLELLDPKHALPAELVKRCHAAQLRFLALSSGQIDDRVCDGRIVDGHGDLRPEHVCLENEPVIFDCLEFNDELRRVDVADELAFLAMECDCLGAEQLGWQVLETYQKTSGDRFSRSLWNFYKCYRACVRAKVATLAARQCCSPYGAEAHRRALTYLARADQYARQLGPPTMLVVCGLMGSGKTTLAAALAKRLGSDVLSTDSIRHELLGASPLAAAYNEGHYTPKLRRQVYGEMFRRASLQLREGVSQVLDGAFLTTAKRRAAMAVAKAAGAAPLFVHCVCPDAVAVERIERRASGPGQSEARGALYASQRAAEAPFDESDTVEVDTTAAICLQEAAVLKALGGRLRGCAAGA